MSAPRTWLQALSGHAGVAARLGDDAQIADMLKIEALYARAAGRVGKVDADMAEAAAVAIEAVAIDQTRLRKAAARDGAPVPDLVAQIKDATPASLYPAIHKGMTSQDVMDTAFVLAARDILEELEDLMSGVLAACDTLDQKFGGRPLMARTRMQAALPVTVAHRIAKWRSPLADSLTQLATLRPRLLQLQLAGPVGTGESFDGFVEALANDMAQELNLNVAKTPWQTQRGPYAELANWLAMVSGSLGQIGADLTLMAQQGIDEATLSGGGSSSAMAHKSNPIGAEVLVALSRDSSLQQAGMTLALGHEQERSGVAWTLEWLVLPRLMENTAAGLEIAMRLLGDVVSLGSSSGDQKL